jgi:hypothetical protein
MIKNKISNSNLFYYSWFAMHLWMNKMYLVPYVVALSHGNHSHVQAYHLIVLDEWLGVEMTLHLDHS